MAYTSAWSTDIYAYSPVTAHVKLIAALVASLSFRLQVQMAGTHIHVEHRIVKRHAHIAIWLTLTIQYAYSEFIVAKLIGCNSKGKRKLFIGCLDGCRKGTC